MSKVNEPGRHCDTLAYADVLAFNFADPPAGPMLATRSDKLSEIIVGFYDFEHIRTIKLYIANNGILGNSAPPNKYFVLIHLW